MLLAICIPCNDYVHHQAMLSIIAAIDTFSLAVHRNDARIAGYDGIVVNMSAGSMGAVAGRNNCMDGIDAIEKKQPVETLIWLDSDMIIPPDTFIRLVSHKKDIVGGTYARRRPPHDTLGKTLSDQREDLGDTGLAEVAALPTGCLLTKRSLFRELKRPYWRCLAHEASGGTISEDYVFCMQMREKGHKIWLDLELKIGHIGDQVVWIGDEEKPKASSLIQPPAGFLESLERNGGLAFNGVGRG